MCRRTSGACELRLEPSVTARVELGPSVRIARLVPLVPRVPCSVPRVGRLQAPVRHPDERLFHRPDVPGREPPVGSQRPEVQNPVPVDAAREIDERIDVGVDEVPDGTEHGLASMEAWVPRARHGAKSGPVAEQEDDMVEVVLRFEIDDDRRKSMLLQDRRRAQGALETMDLVRPDDPAKRVEGLPLFFMIVGQRLEPSLYLLRRVGGFDDGAFSRREHRPWRGEARATFWAARYHVDFVCAPIRIRTSGAPVRALQANRSSKRLYFPEATDTVHATTKRTMIAT